MKRSVVAVAFLCLLPVTGCIAAIGNRGAQARAMTPAARAIVREKIAAADRIVALRQQNLDRLRADSQTGVVAAKDVMEAELQLEEARLRLLDLRAELAAADGDGTS
ncbi:MAG: hypothetical protein ACK5AL_11730 [Planctomycetota bacterium]|jgi:hypothetical protein